MAIEFQDNIFELKKIISPTSTKLNIDNLQDYDLFKSSYQTLVEKLSLIERYFIQTFRGERRVKKVI